MADLLALLNTDGPIRAAARGTVSDMPRLVVSRSSGTAFQTIGQTFTTVQINTVMVDNKTAWSASNFWWVCPETGVYEVNGKLRLADGNYPGLSYGIGMDIANGDNASFFWGQGMTTGTAALGRQGIFNSRIIALNAGDPLRLYAWVDSPGGIGVSGAELNAVRIA
jgi:hypothetical protein